MSMSIFESLLNPLFSLVMHLEECTKASFSQTKKVALLSWFRKCIEERSMQWTPIQDTKMKKNQNFVLNSRKFFTFWRNVMSILLDFTEFIVLVILVIWLQSYHLPT